MAGGARRRGRKRRCHCLLLGARLGRVMRLLVAVVVGVLVVPVPVVVDTLLLLRVQLGGRQVVAVALPHGRGVTAHPKSAAGAARSGCGRTSEDGNDGCCSGVCTEAVKRTANT